jgi:hypothetical protein
MIDIEGFNYGSFAFGNSGIVTFDRYDFEKVMVLRRCGYIVVCTCGCGCGVSCEIDDILSIATRGIKGIVNGSIDYKTEDLNSGFGFYIRDIIAEMIYNYESDYESVEYHGSEYESVYMKWRYSLDNLQLFGLPRYSERNEETMLMLLSSSEYAYKLGFLPYNFLYKIGESLSITCELGDSGDSVDTSVVKINNINDIKNYPGYKLYILNGEIANKIRIMEDDIVISVTSEIYNYIESIGLPFTNSSIFVGCVRYHIDEMSSLTIEDIDGIHSDVIREHLNLYNSLQFRNRVTRMSITNGNMYLMKSMYDPEVLKIAMFSSSNIQNIKYFDRIEDFVNIVFMFPSEEYCRRFSVGKWSKKYNRRVIRENEFEDFCITNLDAYDVRKHWMPIVQFETLIYDIYAPRNNLYFDYNSNLRWRWGILTDVEFEDFSVQYPSTSATILIKSISATIRTELQQLSSTLHDLRLDWLNENYNDRYVKSDDPAFLAYNINTGRYFDPAGHVINFMFMSDLIPVDIFGWFEQINRNIDVYEGREEGIVTPEENKEQLGQLWHTYKEYRDAVKIGNYINDRLSLEFPLKITNLLISHFSRFFESRIDVINYEKVKQVSIPDLEGNWRSILTAWISKSFEDKYKLKKFEDLFDPFSSRHFREFKVGTTYKVEILQYVLKDVSFDKIIDVGGGDSSNLLNFYFKNLKTERVILDLPEFDLSYDYEDLDNMVSDTSIVLFLDVIHHVSNFKEILEYLKDVNYRFIIIDHYLEEPYETNIISALNMYHYLGGWEYPETYPTVEDYSGIEELMYPLTYYNLRRTVRGQVW